jgi:hypothetical protein
LAILQNVVYGVDRCPVTVLIFTPKGIEDIGPLKYSCVNVHGSTIYSNKTVEATQMPINDEWIKIWYISTMEYY